MHEIRYIVRQFVSFAGVGAVGFLIDASIFFLMTSGYEWPVHWARGLSALCSLTATWALNRRVTFAWQRSRDAKAEYMRYLFAQMLGLAVNLGVFALCLALVSASRRTPIIALLIGAIAALAVNFITARSYAFQSDKPVQMS